MVLNATKKAEATALRERYEKKKRGKKTLGVIHLRRMNGVGSVRDEAGTNS